ncbi:hypothetical protein ACLQ3J_08300 [Rhodococcus sp. DT1]|jgi:hypothetical protein|uniref:hypothetical protein n=1 Tax=Rhodococcus sp. DT1 TaxID=3416544 RepID=UPI003CFB27BD
MFTEHHTVGLEATMLILLGLVLLLAAVVVGVVGVLTNGGEEHTITDGFSVFGYEVTGSTGTLFLYGIVVGAVGLLGLALLMSGARRSSRRTRTARREAKDARKEAAKAQKDRDRIAEQNSTLVSDANTARTTPATDTAPATGTAPTTRTPTSGTTPSGTTSSTDTTSHGAHQRGARHTGEGRP